LGSADAAVKAASPERGRSEAESLDSAAASPRIENVMGRAIGCGVWWFTHRTDLRSEAPRSWVPHSVRHRSNACAGWP